LEIKHVKHLETMGILVTRKNKIIAALIVVRNSLKFRILSVLNGSLN